MCGDSDIQEHSHNTQWCDGDIFDRIEGLLGKAREKIQVNPILDILI